MADGKLVLGDPSMVSLTHFPYFYALYGPAHGEQYRDDYECGRRSRATKRIMDTLAERRPQPTKELKRSARLGAAKSRPIFDQAMAALQHKRYLTMVEGYDEPTFTYVWDLPEAWLPGVAQLQQEGTIEIDAPIAERPGRWLV